MTRKKVKLAWIASDSARRASLKKRRQGMLKKVHELSTLCDLDACVIIYSPDNPEPLIWPSHALTYNLLARFQSIPEVERGKKMLNQENYVKERLDKTKENLKRIYRVNKEMEITHLMSQIHNGFKAIEELNGNEIRGLTWLLEEKCREVRKRCDYLSNNQMIVAAPPASAGGSLPPDQDVGTGARDSKINLNIPHSGTGDPSVWDPWYSNLMNNNNVAGTSTLSGVQMTQVKQEFDLMPPQFNYNGYFGGGANHNRHLGFQAPHEGNFTVDFGSGMRSNYGGDNGGGANLMVFPQYHANYHHHGYLYGGLDSQTTHHMGGPRMQSYNHHGLGMFRYGFQFGGTNADDHYGLAFTNLTKNWKDDNNNNQK